MATDQLGQSNPHQVNIILDNTSPVVPLKAPQTDQKLAGNLKITTQVGDLHLQQYRLKYTQDLPQTSKSKWEALVKTMEVWVESLADQPRPPMVPPV